MILRFCHKSLERLFADGNTSGVNAQLAAKPRHMLIILDRGKDLSALNQPGDWLHSLKGEQSGQ